MLSVKCVTLPSESVVLAKLLDVNVNAACLSAPALPSPIDIIA